MDDPKVKKIFFWIKIFKYPNSKSYHPKVKFQDLLPKCVLSFAKLSLEVEIIVGHLQVAVPQLQLSSTLKMLVGWLVG